MGHFTVILMRFKKVYLEITNVCNLNCSFCHKTSRAPGFISESQFDLLTDKLIGYTDYIYFHLMGEPLLHPELTCFLSIAKAKGFKSIITTNGTLISDIGDKLIETSAIHKVNISLQAFEGNLLEDLNSYVRSCAEFALKASDNGVICVFRLWNINGADSMNTSIIDYLKEYFSHDWNEAVNGYKLDERVFLDFANIFEWPDLESEEISSSCYCYGLKDQLGILCDGTVVPCCLDSDGVIKLGNIYETELEDILSSKRVLDIIDGFKKRRPSEEMCRRCGYARRFDK